MHTISSISLNELGRFARFAQAVYLLGRVLRHASEEAVDDAFHEEHTVQLNRALLALSKLLKMRKLTPNMSFARRPQLASGLRSNIRCTYEN